MFSEAARLSGQASMDHNGTGIKQELGLNNKAKVNMRKSYGFRTFRLTELAVYQASADGKSLSLHL
jgi:hypothetical protein